MRHPEKSNSLIAVVIGVNQKDYVAFSNLLVQVGSLVRSWRRIDYRGSHILWCSDGWWYRNLWKGWLDLGGHEDILD